MSGSDLRQRLAAILAADAVGYSRLMSLDERRTVQALDAARSVFRSHIESSQGRVIDMAGDSVLAVFETATGAASAAIAIQAEVNASADAAQADRRMRFRIGLHLGDVIEKADGTVYGDGVNIAARLEGLAEPGGVTISESIHTAVRGKLAATFVDQGEQQVKNIAHPIRAYRVQVGEKAESVTAGMPSSKPSTTAAEIDLPLPDKPSIAVLPFANMSGDPEQEFFTDGITEDIITELSRFHSLFVIARNSSFTFKGKPVDVRTVSRELGVRYVLEGSIRKSANRIRVSGQLIDALTGSHIWAEKYDRELEDIFAVQEEVTECIVAAVAPQIDHSEHRRAARRRPGNLSAYELALRASALVREGSVKSDRTLLLDGLRQARAALAIDPESLLALEVLAFGQAMNLLAHTTVMEREAAWHEGMEAASRAIAFANSASSHAFRAWLLANAPSGSRWAEARIEADAAFRLNPQDTTAIFTSGFMAYSSGDASTAIRLLERSLRINPLDPLSRRIYQALALAHWAARDYRAGLAWAKRAITDAPGTPHARGYLAVIQVGLGEVDEAKAELAVMGRLAPELLQRWLEGGANVEDEEIRSRFTAFIRIAAGLEDPSAADALR